MLFFACGANGQTRFIVNWLLTMTETSNHAALVQNGAMKQLNEIEFWLVAGIATLIAQAARLGNELFVKSTNPPSDPLQAKYWRTKRHWLVFSELMALPFFPSIALLISLYSKLDQILCIGISMALGFLGLAFVLDVARFAVKKRLEMPTNTPEAS